MIRGIYCFTVFYEGGLMSVLSSILTLISIVLVGAGGVYAGLYIARHNYRLEVRNILRERALNLLIDIGAQMNFYYALGHVSTSGPALKIARQRSLDSIGNLARLEETVRSLGDHPELVENVRELSQTLLTFGNFCETTAIPGYSKLPALLDDQLGNYSAIHKRLIEDISKL